MAPGVHVNLSGSRVREVDAARIILIVTANVPPCNPNRIPFFTKLWPFLDFHLDLHSPAQSLITETRETELLVLDSTKSLRLRKTFERDNNRETDTKTSLGRAERKQADAERTTSPPRDADMAGSTRYIRYILLAFVALVVIFFISSSSSSTVGNGVKSATDLLKKQGSLYKGSHSTPDKPSRPATPPPSFGSDEKLPLADAPEVLGNPPKLSHESPPEPMHSGSPNSNSTSHTSHTSPNPAASGPHKLGTDGQSFIHSPTAPGTRMNATFVTLARNSDVWEISRSIRQVEDRFNRNYNYDWVFLNDDDFDETFKKVTTTLTSGRARYGKIGEDHWGFPSWIDQEKAATVREQMREKKIIYGDSISYRHMCRYESGFFFRHPLMMEYEYYWRVEPSIELFCDISYDPFKFMADNGKKYSFVLSLYEYRETIPTLWDSVKNFTQHFPQHIAKDNSLWWISEDEGKTYNNCHFWSNFEIGSLEWLRSDAYIDYFSHLDQDGGFFYERWGDAPVHSIAAALMLPKEEIHFFNDIAYYHVPFTHCPTGEETRLDLKCHCDPGHNFDWNGYSCAYTSYTPLDRERGAVANVVLGQVSHAGTI